jgi:hypothetical protein
MKKVFIKTPVSFSDESARAWFREMFLDRMIRMIFIFGAKRIFKRRGGKK